LTLNPPLLQTPLHEWHRAHGGRLVEFGGWSMPVQYTTIVEEHEAVRKRVGLFDISHMGRLTFDGTGVIDWLERVTTNRVASLDENQIQYSLIANKEGGVIDDILVYRQPFSWLVVCNASNRDRVVLQIELHRSGAVANFADRTRDTAMIAVQGPRARETLQPLFDQPLASVPYYHLTMGRLLGSLNTVISRTGYTGEDGFEVIVSGTVAVAVWEALLKSGAPHGVIPCGLAARDTLRLEAAMPLYGHELSDEIDPFSAGLAWAVKLDKGEFVGREALEGLTERPPKVRVGLTLSGKRIARQGSALFKEDRAVGVVTSGTYSPSLQVSLGMAYVEPGLDAPGTKLFVDIRGHREPAEVVALPFYKRERKARAAGRRSPPKSS
jgi:glycine cleavage system T protein (aminomethyltransferase)